MKYFKVCLFILFVLPLGAQESIALKPVRFLLGGALEFGGDDVAEVFFTNGDSQSVTAGQGGTIYIGADFLMPKTEWLSFQLTLGFKYLTTAADNVNITLTRVPINCTALYSFNSDFKLGIGVSNHQAIKFSADGLGDDLSFDAAIGPRIEFTYKGIGLSYTHMTYKDEFMDSYSANNVGVVFTYIFYKRNK